MRRLPRLEPPPVEPALSRRRRVYDDLPAVFAQTAESRLYSSGRSQIQILGLLINFSQTDHIRVDHCILDDDILTTHVLRTYKQADVVYGGPIFAKEQ